MELKDFIKQSLSDIIEGVEELRRDSSRDLRLSNQGEKRTVEFDIAVSAEENLGGEGKAGIQVWKLMEAGGSISQESKNSTVSRIQFGVDIDLLTKPEKAAREARIQQANSLRTPRPYM